MGTLERFWIDPPWRQDASVADRLWRVILSVLGPGCDELWLRFGNLEEVKGFLSAEQYQALEAHVGPHWGVSDPAGPPPEDEALSALLGALQGVVSDLRADGFVPVEVPVPSQQYEPYGCAVVPLTPALLKLLINLTAVAGESSREMLSRLSDHWHFRHGQRDVIGTADGMSGISLNLTPAEVDAVTKALASAGLDPNLLRRST